MKNLYHRFDEIHTSYWNGAVFQTKRLIKDLTRNERYELIVYSRTVAFENGMVEKFIEWIIRGKLK